MSNIIAQSGSIDKQIGAIHGQLFYDDVNVPVETIRNTTRYPEQIKNDSNKFGSNKAAYFANSLNSNILLNDPLVLPIDEVWNVSIGLVVNEVATYRTILGTSISSLNNTLHFLANESIQLIDSTGYVGNYLSSIIVGIYTLTLSNDGLGNVTIARSDGYSETHSFTSGFEFTKLGYHGISGRGFEGYMANLKKNGISIDPLNGTTTGTPTNITWDKIVIPNSKSTNQGLWSDGTAVITFDDLTGISITSYDGTATATINGDTIEVSQGYINNLLLDNGDLYPLLTNTDKS